MTPIQQEHTQATNPSSGKPAGSGADTVEQLLAIVETSLDDDQAIDAITINLKGKGSLGDYMVIASGRSVRHVGAIADHLLRAIKESGVGSAQTEGQSSGDWVLIDTGDIIIHLFRPEVREFYNLEKMWSPELSNASDDDDTEAEVVS